MGKLQHVTISRPLSNYLKNHKSKSHKSINHTSDFQLRIFPTKIARKISANKYKVKC